MKDIAVKTLDYYHDTGLWVAVENKDKTYSIVQRKLSDEQYKAAKEKLKNLNGLGFPLPKKKK